MVSHYLNGAYYYEAFMTIIALDFETYYDNDYSLSKMSTEAYIRDPRFEVIGVSVSHGHGAKWYAKPDVEAALRGLPWKSSSILAYNCVTGDHEVRTPGGWIRLDQLQEGEKVMQWDSNNALFSWCVPKIIQKQYNGKMVAWDTLYHKGIYTPEHRMYYATPNISTWRVNTIAEIVTQSQNNVYIPVTGELENETDQIDMSSVVARLMEMIRADGNILVNAIGVRLLFKKIRKIERAISLLEVAGWSYRRTEMKNGTRIYIHSNP